MERVAYENKLIVVQTLIPGPPGEGKKPTAGSLAWADDVNATLTLMQTIESA